MGFSPESYTIMTMCRLQKGNTNFTVNFKFSDKLRKDTTLLTLGVEDNHGLDDIYRLVR